MPFWALLGCFLHPFCGEGRADHVWKGHVWGWKCYCFKGEKTKEWKNEDPLFNAQTSCSILLKSQFLSSTLGVLSSKRLTFQAQTLDVLSPKKLTFKVQCLMFYLSKVQRFKLKSLTSQAQKSNVSSSKAQISSLESCCLTLLCLLFCSFFF